MPRQEGDGGVRLSREALDVSWWAWIDASRVSYRLHSHDTWAFPETSVMIRRFGNVVIFGSSPPDTATAMEVRADHLMAQLR